MKLGSIKDTMQDLVFGTLGLLGGLFGLTVIVGIVRFVWDTLHMQIP